MDVDSSDWNHDDGEEFVHDFLYLYMRSKSKCILLAWLICFCPFGCLFPDSHSQQSTTKYQLVFFYY